MRSAPRANADLGTAVTSVLVVDDCRADRLLLVTVLRDAGYIVSEAASGELAIELARSQRPNLIITDILMPDMDGYELVRELRREQVTADVTVIFSAATYLLDEVRRLAAACGVSRILVKPCEPEEIIRTVGEALLSPRQTGMPLSSDEFHREHIRVLNAKLLQKVEELAHADHEATESLALLETLQSSAPVGFGFLDREYRLRRVNDVLAAIGDAPVERLLGRKIAEVLPELWAQLEPACAQVLKGSPVVNQEVHAETPAAPGEARAWLANLYPVRIDDAIGGIGIIVVDITDRLLAEEFRSAVMDNMAEGLYAIGSEGRLMFMNAAATRMLGWSEDELRGRPMHDAIHFQHADGSRFSARECELSKAALEGGTIRVAGDAFTRKDGSIFPVTYSSAPLTIGTNSRGAVVVFHDTTEERAEQARTQRKLKAVSWVGRIRDALDEQRMVLYSQPVVPLAGGRRSEELLVRMVGLDGEIVPPDSFLPVAEKYGLIAEIDQWVIGKAAHLAASGRRVAVNLSPDSIEGADLLAVIRKCLNESGTDPANLIFEITETAIMRDIEAGDAFAHGLAEIGCELALDDFGTGFGGFTYVIRLPIQYLKIDVEFVRDLLANHTNRHVVKAIVALARGLGQQTVAEGVEDAQTLELLRDYGVDFAQGFYIGRPAPIEDSPAA
jgi:PAS domain S-box-containing protein